MLGLQCTRTVRYYILVVVDRFFKSAHFIACKKSEVASTMVHLFFREVMCLHIVPKTINSNRDVKFIRKFCGHL